MSHSTNETFQDKVARFWARIDKSGGEDACWNWTASTNEDGYGTLMWCGKMKRSHRIAYELTYGKPPGNLYVCHKCDNPSCCNPSHLWLGTPRDNMRDMRQKGHGVDNRGEKCGTSKLTRKQVDEIRSRYASGGVTQKMLAIEFGVSRHHISRIIHFREWV